MEKIATEIYQPQLFWLKWDVLFPELFSDFMTQHIFWWFFLTPVGFGSRGWAVRGLNHPSLTYTRIGSNHYRCTFLPILQVWSIVGLLSNQFSHNSGSQIDVQMALKNLQPQRIPFPHSKSWISWPEVQWKLRGGEYILFLKLVWKQVLSNWHMLAQFSVKNIYIGNQEAQIVVLSLPWMAGEIWSNNCTSLGLSFLSCRGWPWRTYLFPLDFI